MNQRSFSVPSLVLAEILGSTALWLGSLGAQMTATSQQFFPVKPVAPLRASGDIFAFGDLGLNHLRAVADNNLYQSMRPNYVAHRPEITARVAEARQKTDAGSLRLVAWDDETKLAAGIEDPVFKVIVVQGIVHDLVKYNSEKSTYSRKDRTGTKWEIWDQTLVQTIEGNEDEAQGTGICLDIADAIMETGLRAGIDPKNTGVAIMDLIPINGIRPDHPDRHADDIVNTGINILVVGQNKIFVARAYFGLENPEIPGTRAEIVRIETLAASGEYIYSYDQAPSSVAADDLGEKVSRHDQKIKDQIEARKLQLIEALTLLGVMQKPTLVMPYSYKLPCGAMFPGHSEIFARAPEPCRFAVAPNP